MIPRTRTAALTAAALLAAATAVGATHSPQAAPLTPPCTAADLRLSLGQEEYAAGSIFIPVNFTNTSTRVCSLRGYPGVSVLDAGHQQIGSPATHSSSPTTTVTVDPGQTVSATIRTNNAAVAPDCRPLPDYIGIYPPASFQQVLLPYQLLICGAFETSPVQVAG
ncbi:hypothetical protein BKI49_12190 [Streptomyces sp. Tue6028]|uniref:DUF4232 domain-containing protein n=1 Tax=Streptomyces sp. Tue6028 TaxID=2036037 RepID=UPI000BB34BEB|nr:DUF4232 domain-containing protein [Streptomyces sp. Tue6028]PBC63877.1 hypothetical protein BKI49_12190 [Streptomyces sp. Tue6028]